MNKIRDVLIKCVAVFIVLNFTSLLGNPFKIHPTEYSFEKIQEALRQVDIEKAVEGFYVENNGLSPVGNFQYRIGRGVCAALVKEGSQPVVRLEKIGEGGRDCVVTYATLDGDYPLFVRSLLRGLKESGFNGYVYYRIGGYPNPTGKEIEYCGVPYTFKVWMMLEAHQMGFDRILWLDSAVIPLPGVTSFFEYIGNIGGYFWGLPMPESNQTLILPVARQRISDLIGVDVMQGTTLMGAVFGWDFSTSLSSVFLEHYYRLVEDGYPFFSCLPEEFVIGAILSLPEFASWNPRNRYVRSPIHDSSTHPDSLEHIANSKRLSFPLHHRAVRNRIEGWDE